MNFQSKAKGERHEGDDRATTGEVKSDRGATRGRRWPVAESEGANRGTG